MMEIKNEAVLILDFGGQYSQLIARRVRELNVYCEIKPYRISAEEIKQGNYKGIIFSGGPNSVYAEKAPKCDPELFELGIPVLGICYGAQLMANMLGGEVSTSLVKEYGNTNVLFDSTSTLFQNASDENICWMSHTDYISKTPEGFKIVARTDDCPVAAMEDRTNKFYAMQFHPEVQHTKEGMTYLKNFLYNACACKGDWKMSSFVNDTIQHLKETIGDKKVLCALSGGVDSSVAAVLVHKAIGKNLTCIFVDHGLIEPLRYLFKDEVRKAGLELLIPSFLVWRQPFPGPGLAIRVLGEITDEKLDILKDADAIMREEIANAGLDKDINQYFAVLTNIKSVGVMGDGRTYDSTIALRAVTTSDFMTADWAHIPYDVLGKISSRIINEVKHVNRVVYDITSKPPATIEWE